MWLLVFVKGFKWLLGTQCQFQNE